MAQHIKLKHLVSIPVTTGTGAEAQEYNPEELRYIRISDFDKSGRIIDSRKVSISYETGKNYLLNNGDILVAVTGGTVGKSILFECDEQCAFAGYLARIRTDETKLHNRYLMYYMMSPLFDDFKNTSVTKSTMENISASKYANMPVVIYPIEQQRRIASFLDRACGDIDFIVMKTQSSIMEYKKLKQAVITQAVTKGVRGKRGLANTTVEWLGKIPTEWKIYRIANLYDERSESGLEELPILTVSINSGVSDYEIADEDKDRVFVRSEDRTKYKSVYPGDLAYNMMRAWQGAFGAVRVDGMVSPAYVVAKPKPGVQLDSRYMEALLRTPAAIEEMHRYSRGIVDFRLRLYWPEFKNIRICLPPLEEQMEIADYIDQKSAELDALIAKKEQFLAELENYKKSLIYEYVTGKKEVQ